MVVDCPLVITSKVKLIFRPDKTRNNEWMVQPVFCIVDAGSCYFIWSANELITNQLSFFHPQGVWKTLHWWLATSSLACCQHGATRLWGTHGGEDQFQDPIDEFFMNIDFTDFNCWHKHWKISGHLTFVIASNFFSGARWPADGRTTRSSWTR